MSDSPTGAPTLREAATQDSVATWKDEALRLAANVHDAQQEMDSLSRAERQSPNVWIAADQARLRFVAAKVEFSKHLDRAALSAQAPPSETVDRALNVFHKYAESQVRAGAQAPPAPEIERGLYRHKKTGGVYALICIAQDEAQPERLLAVYRNTVSGARWVRSRLEFFDGRFEKLAGTPQAAIGAPPDSAFEPSPADVSRAVDIDAALAGSPDPSLPPPKG